MPRRIEAGYVEIAVVKEFVVRVVEIAQRLRLIALEAGDGAAENIGIAFAAAWVIAADGRTSPGTDADLDWSQAGMTKVESLLRYQTSYNSSASLCAPSPAKKSPGPSRIFQDQNRSSRCSSPRYSQNSITHSLFAKRARIQSKNHS
jgi:hypothetical protein